MTISTLVLSPPISTASLPDHPALKFYTTYAKDFQQNFHTCDPQKYYNANCKMYGVDRSEIQGASKMWEFFGSLYSAFPYVNREFLSMIVVSDDEAGTHDIHAEIITTVHPKGKDQPGWPIPQSFVYVLGKAVSVDIGLENVESKSDEVSQDEGKGTYGLQYHELRNYYDFSLLQEAKSSIGR